MIKNCKGCGAKLTLEKGKIGYTNNLESELCIRCFNIKNYNKYEKIVQLEEVKAIIKEVKESNDTVVFVVDIFNISNKIKEIIDYLNNNVILCITKYDLIEIDENKIIKYIQNLKIKCLETIVISAKNNYNLDNLMNIINEKKVGNNVYFVGYTNAGKSSLINKIIKNYSSSNQNLTTSILPSTTLNSVKVEVNDNLTLIDTPGIIVSNIIDNLDEENIKKIVPKKKIKPQIYQIKTEQTIMVENFLGIKIKPYNTVVFYASENLKYNRYYSNIDIKLNKKTIKVPDNSELIINGFGIIKIKKQTEIILYSIEKIEIEIRKALF